MKYKCKICGYIHEGDLPDDYICPICGYDSSYFEKIGDELLNDDITAVVDSIIEDVKANRIINDNPEDKRVRIDPYNPGIMRINEKCINCGLCLKTCSEDVNISYDLNKCDNPICLSCGQCILKCPVGAIVPRYNYREVKNIIDDNSKIVVALTSPGVRVAIGEPFGFEPGENMEGKLVSSLRKLGFDYVFDTTFGADVTIVEEVAELAKRISNKGVLPQFTSCCPAWIKYAEIYHPELIPNISTCKSPIGMQCALIKSYFCEERGFDPNKVITVAITPCTSKKMEAKEYSLYVDYVITTSELALLIKEENIKFESLDDALYDDLMNKGSGSGVIFGNTGGVMEAAVRELYKILTKKVPTGDFLRLNDIRGMSGIKEANIDVNGFNLKVAVVHGMKNLEELLKDNKYKKYHFIEVMNCPGGCIGGGGQPLTNVADYEKIRLKRIEGLYNIDNKCEIKCSQDNPNIRKLYTEYLGKPLSEKSEKLLHTSYNDKSNLLGN